MQAMAKPASSVNAVSFRRQIRPQQVKGPKSKPKGNWQANPDSQRGKSCYRCRGNDHFARDPKCPARNKKCEKCGILGHIAECCHTNPRRYMNRKPSNGPRQKAYRVSSAQDEPGTPESTE